MAQPRTTDQPTPQISRDLKENVNYLNGLLGIGQGPGHSWDLMAKDFTFSDFQMTSYVLNGYFLTMNVVLILEDLEKRIRMFVSQQEGTPYTLGELVSYLNTNIAFLQVQPVPKMTDAVRFILSGPMVTFIDGFDTALLIDTRIYPMRSIAEPEVGKVVRGPRDGFVETMLMNTALIRRRLRDPSLRAELMQVGSRSKTDVTLMYMAGVAKQQTVDLIREKLQSITAETITMAEQSVTDLIGKLRWNPFPIVRYTERPDVAATALVEGHVLIVVDTTPEVIIAPISLFQLLQHPEEYHLYPLPGTYTRWVIFLSTLISVLLPGLFLLINFYPELVPKELIFFRATRGDPLPLWGELLLAEIFLDILRLAVINSPMAVSSMVSIIAAIIFGQFVEQIHLLQPEVLVYMSFVLIAQFALSSYELATANHLARIYILLLTQVGHVFHLSIWGFALAVVSLAVLLGTMKSFGVPYLWPLIPFQWKNGLANVLVRRPTTVAHGMPAILRPKGSRHGQRN